MPHSKTTYSGKGCHLAVAAVFIALGAVYTALFFHLYPYVPWNGDDWTYLGLFQSLLPSIRKWNPARILPEFLMPLSGYFAAYVLRPFCGVGYLQALTLTCSGIAAAAWLALSIFAYRFFLSMTRERVGALCGLLMLNAGFLLANSLQHPLVIDEFISLPTVLFFYDLPNILNAVLAMALCQLIMGGEGEATSFAATPLSVQGAQKHATTLACGLIIAYFAQFSMTISSAISAIPAGSLLLIRLIRHAKSSGGNTLFGSVARKCTLLDLACFLLVAFWCIAQFYELRGARYASLSSTPRPFSEILSMFYYAFTFYIPLWLWLTLAALLVVNIGILAHDKKSGTCDGDAMGIFLGMMSLSFFLLVTLNILIFSVANMGLDNRFCFGLTFYFYILLIVNALFLQKRVPLALAGMPMLFLLIAYAALAKPPWIPRPIFNAEYRKTVVQSWLDDIAAADEAGETAVHIRTPTVEWPHPKDDFGYRLARTLYHHGISSKHMIIHIKAQGRH